MDADVIIAGAGPVGLMLAAELRLHGVTTLVLDPLPAPSSFSKAFGLHIRSTETLALRGLVEPVTAAGRANPARMFGGVIPPVGRGGGVPLAHFAGIRTVRLDLLDSAHPGMLAVSQQAVEAALGERAAALGAEIRRGAAVTGFTQDPDGVSVATDTGEPLRARYLVGCDGGRSTVRKHGGFAFPGTDPTVTGRLAETSIQALVDTLGRGWHRTAGGIVQILPNRICTVEFGGSPTDRNDPMGEPEMLASIRRVTGQDVGFDTPPTMLTRFTDNTRLAESYRDGRVLLAGDAAHVHSPFGGQGQNLGLQDAVNLGWKLAATLGGRAPDGLLDSYQQERRPVAARVLHNTRAQVALMNPDPAVTPLRELFAELMELDPVNRYLGEMLSASGVRYDIGCDHPLAGTFLPAELADLEPLFHDGRGVLLLLGGTGGADRTDGAGGTAELARAASGWADRVRPHQVDATTEPPAAALLVRPDGYLAWAGDDPQQLRAALTRWFGADAPGTQLTGQAEAAR
jgi:2-polyprenyl-6-methoxyphenol hydroxylase-like FAD-dependent oxidoreductase